MKRAKSIFLWCGELVERRRGWLPYWGGCSKNVRTSSKKHRQLGNKVNARSGLFLKEIIKFVIIILGN